MSTPLSALRSPLSSRRGSALVIVLGMLSVMLLMAVAFSMFMRTERAGTTNLKNIYASRQALATGVVRAMAAIDDSFADPRNDWPVPIWPQGWLNSSGKSANMFYGSDYTEGTPDARVLNTEMARYLTNSQLMMARSANPGWAPIYGSVRTEGVNSAGDNGKGLESYPGADDLIGRYAFVVIPTYGYLDLNLAGQEKTSSRSTSTGANPYKFRLITSSDVPSIENDEGIDLSEIGGKAGCLTLNGLQDFSQERKRQGWFMSWRDLKQSNTASNAMNFAWPNGKLSLAAANASNPATDKSDVKAYFPVDLFSSYTMSLEESDPEGEPKVSLPSAEEFKKFSADELEGFTARTYNAMTRVFAHSRLSCDGGKQSNDDIPIFAKDNKDCSYKLPRPALATVALIDALDDDYAPGQVGGKNVWEYLTAVGGDTYINGSNTKLDLTFSKPASSDLAKNPLNFPCTDNIPKISGFIGKIDWNEGTDIQEGDKIDSDKKWKIMLPVGTMVYELQMDPDAEWTTETTDSNGSPAGSKDANGKQIPHATWLKLGELIWDNGYVLSQGTLSLGAKAVPFGGTNEDKSVSYKLEVKAQALPGLTKDGTSSALDPDAGTEEDVAVSLYKGEASGPMGKSNDFRVMWLKEEDKHCEYNANDDRLVFGSGNEIWELGTKTSEATSGSTQSAVIEFEDWQTDFYVYRFVNQKDSKQITLGTETNADGETQKKWTFEAGDIKMCRTTFAEQNESENAFIPIRFTAKVLDGSKTVQQVPAPALSQTDDCPIIHVGVWHGENTKLEKDEVGYTEPAPGWAFCLDPMFAFDTKSMWTQDDNFDEFTAGDYSSASFRPWLNDIIATTEIGGGSSCKGMLQEFTQHMNNRGDCFDRFTSLGPAWKLYGSAQITPVHAVWMWASEAKNDTAKLPSTVEDVKKSIAYGWMLNADDCGFRPDLLHSYRTLNADGDPSTEEPFVKFGGDNVTESLANMPASTNITSAAALGQIVCGPWETLSTFRTLRAARTKGDADFHPVIDYFTTSTNRWPNAKKLAGMVDPKTGNMDLDDDAPVLFTATHNGRVNLNPPPLVHFASANPARAKAIFARNPFPIATVLNDAMDGIGPEEAIEIAQSWVETVADMDKTENKRFDIKRPLVKSVAQIGDGKSDEAGAILQYLMNEDFIKEKRRFVDSEREALLSRCADGFTTRSQTYLILLRADAYTPRFGDENNVENGQTLATTHAILEVFRDPVPTTFMDGTYLDAKNKLDPGSKPVLFHDWTIRSFRVF